MTRYVTKRRARAGLDCDSFEYWDDAEGITVFEPSDEPEETGLLNAQGDPLYRVPERRPIGFHLKPRVRVKAGRS